MNTIFKGICVLAATLAVVACTDYDSTTNLNDEGPPMVQQVRLRETYTTVTGFRSDRRIFAFGTHPQVRTQDEAHAVAEAKPFNQALRVIFDELLVGNNLEEIACRGNINGNGAYSRVPLGTTPDDIAKCSAAQDILPRTCAGKNAVCMCDLDAGCAVQGTTEPIAKGAPVGVLDVNQDGSADDTQLIASAVQIQCTPAAGAAINVPLDNAMSYWNPSGNQQVPAMGGFDALGPALVLVPTGLPVSTRCQLVFDASVVDKQGEQICAPPNGDVMMGCNGGELTAFEFGVEALDLLTGPLVTGENRAGPIIFIANTNLDPTTIDDFTITPAPPVAPVVTLEMGRNIKLTFSTPLAPMTTYTITFTNLRDSFGQPSPDDITFTFTTGA